MKKRTAFLTLALLVSLFVIVANAQTRRPQKRVSSPPPQPTPEASPTEPTAQEIETLKTDTNLVTIPVVATDPSGLYVPDLRQDELTITEDGVQQNIAFFSTVSAPFHVVLMLDTSASTQEKLRSIQDAAIAFVEQLQSADRVAVISFDEEVRELSNFTNDRAQLRAAILKTRPGKSTRLYDAFGVALDTIRKVQGRKAIVLFTDGVDSYSLGATYDGTLYGLDEEGAIVYPIRFETRAETEQMLRQQARDQSIPSTTGGILRLPPPGTTAPTFPSDDPDTVPTTGTRRNSSVLADILRGGRRPSDPYPPDNRVPDNRVPDDTVTPPSMRRRPDTTTVPSGRSGPDRREEDSIKVMLDQAYLTADAYLKALADKSGGRVLRADTLRSLPDAFARIAAELRTQYSIGYYPTNAAHDGLYRKIKIGTSRKKVQLRARPGYRAPNF